MRAQISLLHVWEATSDMTPMHWFLVIYGLIIDDAKAEMLLSQMREYQRPKSKNGL